MRKITLIILTPFYFVATSQTYTVTQDPILNDTYTIKRQNDAYENPKYVLPQTYNYGNFSDAFTNAFNQGIQNSANLSAIRANRAASEAQRIQALNAQEQRRLKYEEQAVKNPSKDFQRGYNQTLKRVKVGKNRYYIDYFRPETWGFKENKSKTPNNIPYLVFLGRELSDGTIIRCWINIKSGDEVAKQYEGKTIDELMDKFANDSRNMTKLYFGYKYDLSKTDENGFLKILYVAKKSAFEDAGIKKGDVLISIDGMKSNQENFRSYLNDLLKDKEFGYSTIVEVKRDGVVIEGPIMPKIRDGFFEGNINISGNKGIFRSTKQEAESYGEVQEYLHIYNWAKIGSDLIDIQINIQPKSLEGNLDFEFRRFKKSIMYLLNNIKITKW